MLALGVLTEVHPKNKVNLGMSLVMLISIELIKNFDLSITISAHRGGNVVGK